MLKGFRIKKIEKHSSRRGQGSDAIDNNDDSQIFILIHYIQPKSIFNASNAKIIINYIYFRFCEKII